MLKMKNYVELYLMNITNIVEEKKETKLAELISVYRLNKLNKFIYREDYLRSLYAECLLRFLLCKKIPAINSDIHIEYARYGKPYINGNNKIEFSISHSGNWVVVAISNITAGVDIEEIKHKDSLVIERFFSSNEKDDIYENIKTSDEKYYKLWTLKESYMKFTGLGLQVPIEQCVFQKKNKEYVLADNKQLQFSSFYVSSGYIVSVCTCRGTYVNPYEIVEPSVIYNFFWGQPES